MLFKKCTRKTKGQSMVEYALMLVLVAVSVISILRILGGSDESDSGGLQGSYQRIHDSIAGTDPGCWVAAELYGGWYVPETVTARYYVNHLAPTWFKDLYLAHGEDFAKTLRQHPEIKPLVRPLFEYFSSQGAKALTEPS